MEKSRSRRIRAVYYTLLIGFLSLPSAMAQGEHDAKGEIRDTVGPMSEPIIRQRLKQLGYTNLTVHRTNTLRLQIDASKDGEPVRLELHPQTGEVHDVTPGKVPMRVWTMPVEPLRSGAQP